jgi:hypothetical protein
MKGELRTQIKELVEDELSETTLDDLITFVNEVEDEFNKIRDLLDKVDLANLDNISDAFDIADVMSHRLY